MKSLIHSIILFVVFWQNSSAAENCSAYLDLLKEYQTDHKELLACGVAEDDYFMKAKPDEEATWCEKATQAEMDQRYNQAGLPTLHCGGTLHYFSIEFDTKGSQRLGLIRALYETVTVKPVPPQVLKAIIAQPGKRTGAKLSVFPVQELQGSSPTCQLRSIKTALSTDTSRIHWLVSADPPCQRDEFNQSPFWLVEQRGEHYQVIFAYRSQVIQAQTKRHEGYPILETLHTIDNGTRDDAEITWQYDPKQGQYRYATSRCSNLSRLDDSEPASFEDCYQGETW